MGSETDRPGAVVATPRPDTKELILTTAERLFARHGFTSISVRDITSAAGVNLAAVSYHFGSKEALLLAIFMRRASEVNKARARALREAEARSGGTPPLREVLRALLGPALRLRSDPDTADAFQFMVRAQTEATAEMRKVLDQDTAHLQRFVLPLGRALPHLAQADICWRLHFTLGALHLAATNLKRLESVSGGLCNPEAEDELLDRLIEFAAAGFEGDAFVAGRSHRRVAG
jgi:AcrR family transcriptional regulator